MDVRRWRTWWWRSRKVGSPVGQADEFVGVELQRAARPAASIPAAEFATGAAEHCSHTHERVVLGACRTGHPEEGWPWSPPSA